MRYPTHLNDIQSSLSPVVDLVNKVLDLSGSSLTIPNIGFNSTYGLNKINISGPVSCVLKSAIRVNTNRSTELKKTNETFTFNSATIYIPPPGDLSGATVYTLYNNVIEFTNPSINIPTSVISTIGGKVQGLINTVATYSKTTQTIIGMVADPASQTMWECTVGSTAGFIVGNEIQVYNVGASTVATSPFNTDTIIRAQVVSLSAPDKVRILYSGSGSYNPPGLPGPPDPIPVLNPTSKLVQENLSITNAFVSLQELNLTISGGKAIPDLSGANAPALVSAGDDSLYFAFISRYTSNIAYLGYKDTLYDIVLGHLFPNGTLDWLHRLQGLVTAREESIPVLVIGDQNDLYLAYMTTGATQDSLNGIEIYTDSSTFGICGCPDPSTCTACGYEDVVLARINPTGATSSVPPTIVWKIQDGFINSTYRETQPSISVDTTNQLVYLAYECNKNLACFTPVGSSNILLHCFTMGAGLHLWVKAQTEINSTGANTRPSVASDNLGNVYVAYEVKAPSSGAVNVDGGASVPANEKQIEVVRFQTVFSTPSASNTYNAATTYLYGTWVYYPPTGQWYQAKFSSITNEPPPGSSKWSEPYPVNVFFVQRVWVLSQSVNIFAVGGCNGDNESQPTMVADRTNGNIFLAFLTTGSVMNTDRGGCVHDLVVLSFTKDRVVRWIYQGGQELNPPEITYNDCDAPYIMMDRYGNLLFSLLTTLASGNVNMAVFHYDQEGDSRWGYPRTETEKYPVYMWARTNAPNAVFPDSSPGSFSKIGIGKAYTNIFLGTVTDLLASGQIQVGIAGITNMACISRYNENIYYKDRNAFSYMLDIRSICTCGKENCGCF